MGRNRYQQENNMSQADIARLVQNAGMQTPTKLEVEFQTQPGPNAHPVPFRIDIPGKTIVGAFGGCNHQLQLARDLYVANRAWVGNTAEQFSPEDAMLEAVDFFKRASAKLEELVKAQQQPETRPGLIVPEDNGKTL